jgi:hypothetical protein
MLSIVKRYEITVLKLNRVRFEALREDKRGTGIVNSNFFKGMLKRFGISLTSVDFRDLLAYLTYGLDIRQGVNFSIKMMDKLVDVLSRQLCQKSPADSNTTSSLLTRPLADL